MSRVQHQILLGRGLKKARPTRLGTSHLHLIRGKLSSWHTFCQHISCLHMIMHTSCAVGSTKLVCRSLTTLVCRSRTKWLVILQEQHPQHASMLSVLGQMSLQVKGIFLFYRSLKHSNLSLKHKVSHYTSGEEPHIFLNSSNLGFRSKCNQISMKSDLLEGNCPRVIAVFFSKGRMSLWKLSDFYKKNIKPGTED